MNTRKQSPDRKNRSTAVGIVALAAALAGGATSANEPLGNRVASADRSAESRSKSDLAIRGLPSREETTYYRNGEPTTTVSKRNTYDARRNLIESVHLRDSHLDDLPEVIEWTETREFDARGNLVEVTYLHPANSNWEGLVDACVANYARDELVSWQCNQDLGIDGSIEFVDGGWYRYDRGNLVETGQRFEDAEAGSIVESTNRATFDSRGNRIESVTEIDHGADGAIDSLTTERWAIEDGPHANETEFESVRDSDADGVPDKILRRFSDYDRPGRLVRQIVEEDKDGDGIPDRLVATGHTYDDDGRLATTTVENDYNADGDLDSTVVTEFRYDIRGNIVEELEETDYRSDGTTDVTDRVTRRFDRRGNLLEEVLFSGIRPESNGLPYSTRMHLFVYDEIGNLIEEAHSTEYREAPVPSYGSTVTYTY